MARERVEVEVEGIKYSICEISPTKAALIFIKLVRIFGPAFPKFLKGGKLPTMEEAKKMNLSLRDVKLDEVVEVIADRMEEEEIIAMAVKLLSASYPLADGDRKGGPSMLLGSEAMFDRHFETTPGIMHIALVIKAVLLLQYADFFGGLGIQDGSEEVQTESTTESPVVP